MEKFNYDIENKEKEKITLWFIEDEESIYQSYKRYLELSIDNLKFIYFNSLELAIKKIQEIIFKTKEEKEIYLGDFFIIDGYLKKDKIEFQNGETLVKYLREMKDKIKQPYIIAFSGDDEKNEILKRQGADFVYSKYKSNIKDLVNFIKNPKEFLNQEEKDS